MAFLARLAALFRKRELDSRVDQEMLFHLEMQIEENIRRGMPPQEARRQALISSGGLEQAKELHRESRVLAWMEGLLQDVRYGLRSLRRDAALSTFAILIVGLGVGAGSTVFSVVQALLLRPLPFEEPERLVWISNGDSLNLSSQTVQVNNLLDLRAQSDSFSGIAAFSPFYGIGDVRLTGVGEPERLTAVPVTETFFSLLGVQPAVGRFFTPQECVQNASKTAVLGYRFWQRRFASDPHVVGRSILLDGEPVTVVGVAPESFDFPSLFSPGTRADLFTPFPLSPDKDRQGNTLALIGRLRSGADLTAAQAETEVIAARIAESFQRPPRLQGRRNGFDPLLSPLRERISGILRTALSVLAGAVGILVLLVCVNLSNLLLARAWSRQKELAVRSALGAGRARLIRQTLVESLMLSGAGALLGLLLAIAGTTLLAAVEGVNVPLLHQVRVDSRALAFTLFAAIFTGVAFGLAPRAHHRRRLSIDDEDSAAIGSILYRRRRPDRRAGRDRQRNAR